MSRFGQVWVGPRDVGAYLVLGRADDMIDDEDHRLKTCEALNLMTGRVVEFIVFGLEDSQWMRYS